jgi:hypothetical protein
MLAAAGMRLEMMAMVPRPRVLSCSINQVIFMVSSPWAARLAMNTIAAKG